MTEIAVIAAVAASMDRFAEWSFWRDYLVEVIIPYENSIQILNDQVREKVSKYELQRNHIPWRFSVSRTLVLYLHAYT